MRVIVGCSCGSEAKTQVLTVLLSPVPVPEPALPSLLALAIVLPLLSRRRQPAA